MSLRSIHIWTLLLCIPLFLKNSLGQDGGTIQGNVTNERSEPVVQALVNADPIDNKLRETIVKYVETNETGHFTIDHLAWGTYKLYAMKEQEGYSNTRFAFYSSGPIPTITLSPQSPTASVALRVGPKAAIIRILSITDAVTGKSLMTLAGVGLTRTGIPNSFIGVSPSDHILAPAGQEVTMNIEAAGYEPWPPPNQPALGQIKLPSGHTVDFQIKLQPLIGLSPEIERMVRRAADANRTIWTGKKLVGPSAPPDEDIHRLRELGQQGVVALAQYLKPDKSSLEQGGVVSLLATLWGDEALDLLGEFAQKASDASVRVTAVKRLSLHKRPKDLALLRQVAASDPNPQVREAAAKVSESQ
jgi:hypothetical protein